MTLKKRAILSIKSKDSKFLCVIFSIWHSTKIMNANVREFKNKKVKQLFVTVIDEEKKKQKRKEKSELGQFCTRDERERI